ncbi:MAG: radical SAM protein [Prevotellaceae bacterium]|jgi:anaerobic ribonucleoside-triphosphate reductase activating protein|nr:radical SAM protein [Prevotellaceae bacterium]
MIKFNIALINQCTETEGVFKRLAIWFQGCEKQCAGCCNPELFPFVPANIVSLGNLLEIITNAKQKFDIEGVTYLGGEPTLQHGLAKLSKEIQSYGLGVILFTGKQYEELPQELIGSVDLIIDGGFEKDNPDNERNLIGSKNQRIICVTDRYRDSLDWFYVPRPKREEINVTENLVITGDVII